MYVSNFLTGSSLSIHIPSLFRRLFKKRNTENEIDFEIIRKGIDKSRVRTQIYSSIRIAKISHSQTQETPPNHDITCRSSKSTS